MIFLIESLVACAIFTLFVFLMSRNPIKTIFNYPPAIIERCKSLGLVDDSNRPGGPAFYAKKIIALLVFGVLLGVLARYVNDCTTFWCGALMAYALWCVVNLFDAFVLDCIWFLPRQTLRDSWNGRYGIGLPRLLVSHQGRPYRHGSGHSGRAGCRRDLYLVAIDLLKLEEAIVYLLACSGHGQLVHENGQNHG